MAIQAVNAASQTQTVKRKYNPAKISGYAAIALGVASGVAGNRQKVKLHKQLAYAAGIFTAMHIGIIEWFHHKKKLNTKTQV